MSKFTIRSNKVFYGTRALTFTLLADVGCDEMAGIPRDIDSVDDLDLEAIKTELCRTVCSQSWFDLEVKHTPERVITPEGTDPITLAEQIVVSANGVQIIYGVAA